MCADLFAVVSLVVQSLYQWSVLYHPVLHQVVV